MIYFATEHSEVYNKIISKNMEVIYMLKDKTLKKYI